MAKSGFYSEDDRPNLLHGCDGHVGTPFACPLYGAGCWAEGMAKRQKGRGYPWDNPFRPVAAKQPYWNKLESALVSARRPRVMAINFMGDWSCQSAYDVQSMARFMGADHPGHTFLTLTKNPALLAEKLGDVRLSENVWLGVSVWDQPSADRNIPALLAVPAAHYWVSLEPLWGPVNIEAHFWRTGPIGADGRRPTRIQWVVVGCESGPKRRLFPDHSIGPIPVSELSRGAVGQCEDAFLYAVRSLRDQCAAAQVPFYCKHLPLNGAVVSNVAAFPEDLATMKVRRRPWRAE